IQPDLITLDPTKLGQIDFITMTQKHQERVQRLGYDPTRKEPFEPKRKMKGRSSAANIEIRKKKAAGADQREVIRQSVQEKEEAARKRESAAKSMASHGDRSALDRFHK
ncbi:WD repeat-containing protein 46-like, partial [Chiloscyllium punctatum]|uniref:WD repeat-containing protein 46-like n=1 Tax=Chiloscyllium punctatum TaxID=137246 RepID=UPI003B63A1AC